MKKLKQVIIEAPKAAYTRPSPSGGRGFFRRIEMRIKDYDTMNEIINDLSTDDIEQLEHYARDCQTLGARRTAKYIFNQIRHESEVLIDLIRVKLAEDCSGCY